MVDTNDFILLNELDDTFIFDIKYATTDNFTGKKIYPDNTCLLRKETAFKLTNVNSIFKELGYRLKIWDAYRPVYVQKIFWDTVKDSRYVANPNIEGSVHNKGCAVDITLIDKVGNELIMPSHFDDFSINAHRDNPNILPVAKKNVNLLTNIMIECGFKTIPTEWCHFKDIYEANFDIVDIDLGKYKIK